MWYSGVKHGFLKMVATLNVFLVAKMLKVKHGLEERVKCFSATFRLLRS